MAPSHFMIMITKNMKKQLFILVAAIAVLSSCSRVEPNHVGVLMQNYGKNGKSDYTKVYGRVSVISPGTTLFEVPLWEQRAEFLNEDGSPRIIYLKSADNTEFTVKPFFAYSVTEARAVDVVFQNSQLTSGDEFLEAVQFNVLQPKIYDIMKELSTYYKTDSLMKNSGRAFEQAVTDSVKAYFQLKGFTLTAFSAMIDFPKKAKEKIDQRNEVDQNLLVLDRQIIQQRKQNTLDSLKAVGMLKFSQGLTTEYLQYEFLQKWGGKQPIYGNIPLFKPVN